VIKWNVAMIFSGPFSGVSHSALSDMQCITQEAPSNAVSRGNLDRFSSRGSRDRDLDDEFDLVRSGPPR
jgi:hypothetical protein